MPAAGNEMLWSQELEVHWPLSWRVVTGRDVLLEVFTPQVFNITNETIFLRYAEDQDLRVSPVGMHLRILALDSMDDRIAEVFDKVLHVVEPAKLEEFRASFSHVRPITSEYNAARREFAQVFYNSWIQQRPVEDFALYWDERTSPEEQRHFELGVVNQGELIDRVARAAGMSQNVLRRQMPAWMKVRMPRVAIFMKGSYASDLHSTPDFGRDQVPQMWGRWREESSHLFTTLTNLAIATQEEELS